MLAPGTARMRLTGRTQLVQVLEQCHELHIRWVSPKPYNAIAPFVSRASPGLHVFFTPEKDSTAYAMLDNTTL